MSDLSVKGLLDAFKVNPLRVASLVSEFKHNKKLMKRAKEKGVNDETLAHLKKKASSKLVKAGASALGVDIPVGGTQQEFAEKMPGVVADLAKRANVGGEQANHVLEVMSKAADKVFAESNPSSAAEFLHEMAMAGDELAPGAGALMHQIADTMAGDDDDTSIDKEIEDASN
jgi:hypothetical protein